MEFTGKTLEEAIELGLKESGLKEEEAEIEIIEQPVKGLFGKLKGKAVIKITAKKKEEVAEEDVGIKTVEFVQKILDIMDITAKAQLTDENTVTLIAAKSSEVIGKRGEVLDAIQTLAGAVANIGKKEYKKIVVDCENYREKREETLINLAKRLEKKATEIRREIILEPMNPFERRIIHTALAESQTVKTRSDGREPNRFVVIVPNDLEEGSRPYNAGRNNDRHGNGRRDGYNRHGARGGRRDFRSDRGARSSRPQEKRKTPSTFGTYLGNSMKNDNEQ